MWVDGEDKAGIGDTGQTARPVLDASDTGRALVATESTASLAVTRQERGWAAAAHLSILVTLLLGLASGGIAALLGVAIPAVIWYAHRDKSEYVADQARQATLYQLACFVALLVLVIGGVVLLVAGWVISAVLSIILIGLLLALVMVVVTIVLAVAIVAVPIAQVIYGCYAAAEAYNGRPFRYWWVADMVDRYLAAA